MKKKILFLGPIGDFGGRDIEVNIMAHCIAERYDSKVFSTMYITENSCAVKGMTTIDFTSFDKESYESNRFLRTLANLFYLKNKKRKLPYAYVKNGISKLIFRFPKARKKILQNEIKDADAVIACVQLTSSSLKDAVEISHKLNKPFFIRTTGEVHKFDVNSFGFLKKVTCFIHHSETNAQNLNKQIPLPYAVVDQCAQLGEKLLEEPIMPNQNIYGFLGRLSSEKGILELIEFFKDVKDSRLLIAGKGVLEKKVIAAIKNYDHIEYLGHINPEELDAFFRKINVFVLSSYEESGPLVGLEAMAAGKLILSTEVGAMKERLTGTANDFWFNIDDKQSFLDELGKIQNLAEEEAIAIARKNRERYLEEYQFASIKNKYLNCLNEYID